MNEQKRILFVDDDKAELQALQRLVESSECGWAAEFTGSAIDALGRLEQGSFNVVVSDLRMPELDGGEFLSEVMVRYPKVARILMAEPTDQNLAMDKADVVHQYLPKPCEEEALRASVDRAGDLAALIRRERIMKVVATMDRLPALPSLYIEVLEKLNDPDAPLEDIGEVISRDIAMTVKILKLVNSAYFGLRRKISSPTEAASYLGLDTIRGLVLSLQTFGQYDADSLGSLALESVWNHSLRTAACCRTIASHKSYGKRMADESFVAGMLHDTGRLVIASNSPQKYREAIQRSAEIGIAAAEEEVFGVNHADIGGHLFALWGLPVSIVDAVEFHHEPSKAKQREISILTLVHVADAIVTQQNKETLNTGSIRVDEDYLSAVGLNDRYEDWVDAYTESL